MITHDRQLHHFIIIAGSSPSESVYERGACFFHRIQLKVSSRSQTEEMNGTACNTHVCSEEAWRPTICGKGAALIVWRDSSLLTPHPTHIFEIQKHAMSKLTHANSSQPAWQLFVKVCLCLQQMCFLMKVWGQCVPSQGKGSINNYLPHSWRFFPHPSSTPTAPLLSTHMSRSLIIRCKPKPAFFVFVFRY